MDEERCCGTCTYNEYDRREGNWGCINPNSEGYGLLTTYSDICDDWEERI